MKPFGGLVHARRRTVHWPLVGWLCVGSVPSAFLGVFLLRLIGSGDVVRRLLSSGLGFDRLSRETNIRRLGWVAAEIARHGGMSVLAAIAPYRQTRAEVRSLVRQHGDLVLVHVATPLAECERRDRKGLYARARRGELTGMTGVDDPYEAPDDADLTIDTTGRTIEDSLQVLVRHLESGGWLPPSPPEGPAA
jgi:sulfate adenylyltransferase